MRINDKSDSRPAAAFLAARLANSPEEKRMAYFTGIEKARFKRIVVPGDRLDMETRVVRDRGNFVVMEGIATVEGEKAAEATMMSILAK